MLRIDDHDGVRVLTLDRPDALNAFNTPLYDACAAAFHEAAARDDIACVVLTGTGRVLGGPGPRRDGADRHVGRRREHELRRPGFPRFIDTVAAFEKPLIAAVNGLGVGIGLTVLLHCDLVLISRALGCARRSCRSVSFPKRPGAC